MKHIDANTSPCQSEEKASWLPRLFNMEWTLPLFPCEVFRCKCVTCAHRGGDTSVTVRSWQSLRFVLEE